MQPSFEVSWDACGFAINGVSLICGIMHRFDNKNSFLYCTKREFASMGAMGQFHTVWNTKLNVQALVSTERYCAHL